MIDARRNHRRTPNKVPARRASWDYYEAPPRRCWTRDQNELNIFFTSPQGKAGACARCGESRPMRDPCTAFRRASRSLESSCCRRHRGAKVRIGVSAVHLRAARGRIGLMRASYGAAATIALIVKNSLFTAPMLMYQHSRSGECTSLRCRPGRRSTPCPRRIRG
jgi:hypothetical protein